MFHACPDRPFQPCPRKLADEVITSPDVEGFDSRSLGLFDEEFHLKNLLILVPHNLHIFLFYNNDDDDNNNNNNNTGNYNKDIETTFVVK